MKRIENECVGCDIPCVDCGRKRTPHWYCDKCDEEKTLYDFEGRELCMDCIKEELTVIEGSNIL